MKMATVLNKTVRLC